MKNFNWKFDFDESIYVNDETMVMIKKVTETHIYYYCRLDNYSKIHRAKKHFIGYLPYFNVNMGKGNPRSMMEVTDRLHKFGAKIKVVGRYYDEDGDLIVTETFES